MTESPAVEAQLETLLFVADGPADVERLRSALGVERDALERSIAALGEHLRQRGVRLQRRGDSLQLVSAPEAAEAVERYLGLDGAGKLSGPALETLAIVAYRQPVTRAHVEAIRGVGADYAIRMLLARNLIQEIGRADSVGRPVLFGTTFEFLQYFGFESLDQLPSLPEELIEMAESRSGSL